MEAVEHARASGDAALLAIETAARAREQLRKENRSLGN
jgi:hypothetical protein